MAEAGNGVWGIEVGQAGLKAVRLKYAEASKQVLAVSFDYIPHPKILSQPDAVPDELIAEAIKTFLSRNKLKGDRVVISVPGHAALTRFIQLPPVEASKVADIVKYEAKQQIPFALEDVCWQWQTLGNASEESGYMLETEVGLFAMKRDQVQQHLKPFLDQNIEVDQIQIAPLAIYNFLSYDRLGVRKDDGKPSTDDYTIALDMGADNTTMLASNGTKIWIRNIPIGGNHFTRALTKEMKLTFAKAEHLKLNATKSSDPKAVFQALRPVFNNYVSEIQRSIGFFSGVNRSAKITKIIGVGNGFKLAGLQKFLQQNLQYDVERIDSFQAAVGNAVLGAKLFNENILGFAVPYGLALQGLELTQIHVDLLPEEIRTTRLIRKKKPWAIITVAALLTILAISATGYARKNRSVSKERFGKAETTAKNITQKARGYRNDYEGEKGKYTQQDVDDGQLVRARQGKVMWAELYKAIGECLPHDPAEKKDAAVWEKKRIKNWKLTAVKINEVSDWYETIDKSRLQHMREEDRTTLPKGQGYIITLQLAHYYDPPEGGSRDTWVREQFVEKLRKWTVPSNGKKIPVREIGLTHPVIVKTYAKEGHLVQVKDIQKARSDAQEEERKKLLGEKISRTTTATSLDFKRMSDEEIDKNPNLKRITLTRVTVQFVWQPLPLPKRELFNQLHHFFKKYKIDTNNDKTIDSSEKNTAFEKATEEIKKIIESLEKSIEPIKKQIEPIEKQIKSIEKQIKANKNTTKTPLLEQLENRLKPLRNRIAPFEDRLELFKSLEFTRELFDEFSAKHYIKAASPKVKEESTNTNSTNDTNDTDREEEDD